VTENLTLLRSQQNQVRALVERAGLDPGQFHWTQVQEYVAFDGSDTYGVVSKLVHQPTSYYFLFTFRIHVSGRQHFSTYSPGEETRIVEQYCDSWEAQVEDVFTWLAVLRREVEAPDLWGAIAQEVVLGAGISDDADNSAFTREEQRRLDQALSDIKQYIETSQALNAYQKGVLDKGFGYLSRAKERLGRVDWFNIFVSQMVRLLIRGVVQAPFFREMMQYAGTHLSQAVNFFARLFASG